MLIFPVERHTQQPCCSMQRSGRIHSLEGTSVCDIETKREILYRGREVEGGGGASIRERDVCLML